jgi:hypothetical protein
MSGHYETNDNFLEDNMKKLIFVVYILVSWQSVFAQETMLKGQVVIYNAMGEGFYVDDKEEVPITLTHAWIRGFYIKETNESEFDFISFDYPMINGSYGQFIELPPGSYDIKIVPESNGALGNTEWGNYKYNSLDNSVEYLFGETK